MPILVLQVLFLNMRINYFIFVDSEMKVLKVSIKYKDFRF